MQKTIRKEITIKVEGDIEEAEKEAKRYEKMGYTRIEENEEWIQLDTFLSK